MFEWLFDLFSSRCKFWRHCNKYTDDDVICNNNMGNYYGLGLEFRPGGCYRDIEESGKQSQYWKD